MAWEISVVTRLERYKTRIGQVRTLSEVNEATFTFSSGYSVTIHLLLVVAPLNIMMTTKP